jgi:hypothetical protein
MSVEAVEKRDPLRFTAVLITLGVHGLVAAFYLVTMASRNKHTDLSAQNFVDAQLVRFGKPRDLSFLPHKEGRVKEKVPDIKIARDLNALPHIEEKKKQEETDPLKKTHAELFKHLNDDREGMTTNEGQLTGSKAGTAAEAKGDPYILQIVDVIGNAWTVPTTIRDAELANLSADVCLTISEAGVITNARIVNPSHNSQFDSSLQAALGVIQHSPTRLQPPDRNIQTPSGPRNLRDLATRGRLCPTLTAPGK